MKRDPGKLAVIAFVLLVATVIGCKMSSSTSSNNANSNSNSNDAAKNSNKPSNNTTATAPAPNIAGKYNVTGTNPTGSVYKGTLEVIAHSDVYQFRWNAGAQYDGVGIQNGNIVAAAYTTGQNGQGCGVVDYDIKSDGALEGKWGYWGINEAGTESATRTSGSSLEGEYEASGKNPNGKQYKARLTVEPAGNLYRFVWSNDTDGIGIKRGSNVAVGIGGTRCGFVTYEVQSDGTLDGIWGGGGSDKTGTEKAVKQ
jgi:hypothetical protein